ncbi:probable PHD finger protein MALE MEIOCYTE DEATH 1 [Coccomyxa sp. Obi]|nr:probable PHD finger protein MALE MEIOCYTE DEATH 1 [Coccomyxa sp. Obi]
MDRGTDVGVPWIQGDLPIYTGAFRDNVRVFLKDYGTPVVDLGLPLVSCWNVELRRQQSSVHLQVYEERLNDHSPSYCDPCRIIGWQHHAVCTRRYHFIMPAQLDAETAREHANLPALVALGLAATSGKLLALPSDPTSDDCTASYTAPASVFDSQTHLLHGVLHANGFGHLLRINGLEGGSSALTGRQTMTMWDRLCELLRAREVSVEDVSNKAGMELRVLHMSAYRNTWYGRWGYAFGRGGFGISRATWRRAADTVHKTLMADVLEDFQGSDPALTHIVDRYSAPMGGSKKALTTLGELLQRLLHLLSHADEAAPLLESRGMVAPPLRGAPAGTKTPAVTKHKQQPSGKSFSKKRPAPSVAAGSTPAAKRAATDRDPPPEVPQELLTAELRPSPILLEPLEGRWWKKRWSGDRAKSALAAALSALQKRRGLWTSASRLRKAMRHRVTETSLLEFVISTIANRSVNGANISMDMHPASPEEYFLLDMSEADKIDILQQDSIDAELQHAGEEAPAEAGEAVTNSGPAEIGPASEADLGQLKVEAGSNAEPQAPLEQAEASEAVPPVETAVKEEPCESKPAAAADEPMPGPSPGNHSDAADTAVRGLAACSSAEPTGALSPVEDEQGQPSSAPSLPSTNANATGRQETLQQSEAAQPPQAADAGPSTSADVPQPHEQPEAKVEIAPILTASKQPRLPNGRFLPKQKQRPESAPAAWTSDIGPSMGRTATMHENGASGPLEPDDAAEEPLQVPDQHILITQKSGDGRKRHSMPALACQLPSRRSTRGVKTQHGETHGLEDQNGTELDSEADGAGPAPVDPIKLASNEDAQPADKTFASDQPDTGCCPDSGPSDSNTPEENGVQQLRQWGHRGVRNPRTSSPTRPPKAANGHKGQNHGDDAAPPLTVLATPVRECSPAKEQSGASPVTPDMVGAMPAACTRPRSRLGKTKADAKAAGASASAPAAHGWAKKAAHLNKELTSLDSLGRGTHQSDVSASRLRHTPQVNYSEKKRRDNLKLEAALKRQRISYTAPPAAEGPPPRWFPWQRLTPGARFTPQAGLTARDQVMCDLAHVFNVVMRTYRPAAAAAAAAAATAGNTGEAQGTAVSTCKPLGPCDCSSEDPRAGLPQLRLATLPADVQVLRDVKHFVKDYQGDKLHPSAVTGDTSGSPQGDVRLLVRVQVPERTIPGPSLNSARANSTLQSMSPGRVQKQSGRGAGRGGRGGPRRRPMRKRAMLGPPPELLLLSHKSTIPQLRKAAAVAVSDTYRMFERIEVKRVEGLEAGTQQRGRLGPLIDGTVLTLHGDGIDLDPFWRHAGGVEEWQVACCCGTRDDDGERMIACDGCAEWSHTRCAGFADALPSPDHFLCPRCSRLPPAQRPLALETPQVA